MSKKNQWIELAFVWQGQSKAREKQVLIFLSDHGIQKHETALHFQNQTSRLTCYVKTLAQARKIASQFPRYRGNLVQIRALGEKDWFLKWQDYFKPKNIGRKFVIVPLWEKPKYKRKEKIPIYLDPRGDFGSGCHPSTYLTTQLMLKLSGQFKSFLDVGTGTGVLAIMAANLGAKMIKGFDSHAHSAQTARLNLQHNGVKGRIKASTIAAFKPGKKYDLVAANLGTKPLLDNQKQISGFVRPGGWLIVSGIAGKNVSSFKKEFKLTGFKKAGAAQSGTWSAFLYQKY